MRRFAPARSLLWPVIVLAVGGALIFAAVRFSHTATAGRPPGEAEPATPDQEGLVCFGAVDLEHGVAALAPLQPGRVVEVLVGENQAVQEGAVLLRLEDGIARSRLGEADAAVNLAEAQLRQARGQPELHKRRVYQQRAMRDAMESRAIAARRALAREEKLAKSVVIAESDSSISEEKVREMDALARAETERLAELEAQDVDLEIRRAESELKIAQARREQAKLNLDEYRIRAPLPGTVLRILASPGDVVGGQPGQPAVLFAPDGPRVIRATVEQEFADRVQEGEPALVRDESNTSVSWRGRVSRLAGWYSQRRTLLHDPSQLSDVRTLECVIVLEPGQPPLRLGQSVRIFIGSATR